MRNLVILAALVAAASPALAETTTPVASPVVATKGQMLTGADRSRLGSVVRVEGDGSVGIIFDAHLVTIPGSTLSMADGKLTTTLSKRQVTALR